MSIYIKFTDEERRAFVEEWREMVLNNDVKDLPARFTDFCFELYKTLTVAEVASTDKAVNVD